jgi:hypothetical protein
MVVSPRSVRLCPGLPRPVRRRRLSPPRDDPGASRKVAEEHLAIPLKVDGRALHVAMVDHEPEAIDEISFAVVTGSSPGYRLSWIPGVDKYTAFPAARATSVSAGPDRLTAGQGERRLLDLEDSGARGRSRRRRAAERRPKAAGTTPLGAGPDDEDANFCYGRPWHEVAAELDAHSADTPVRRGAETAGAKPTVPSSAAAPGTLSSVVESLCRANSKEEVVDAVLGHASGR